MVLTQRESIAEIQAAAARVERTLLMIPGPTAITAEVLAAGARPVLSHSDPRMRAFIAQSLARLRSLFDAPAAQPIIAAGSGTLAMEIGLANLIEPGDRVLILESGVFGGRFRTIADRNGAEFRVETAPVGQAVDPDRVRRASRSSTGTPGAWTWRSPPRRGRQAVVRGRGVLVPQGAEAPLCIAPLTRTASSWMCSFASTATAPVRTPSFGRPSSAAAWRRTRS